MKRRNFLALAGISGVLVALPSFKFFSTSFEDAAMKLITKELHFLLLDKKGLEQFVRDYSKNKDTMYKLIVRGYSIVGIGSFRSGKINQLVSTYLLSTDFFANKMDESRILKYQGLYYPYTRPCAHPFSHLQYNNAV